MPFSKEKRLAWEKKRRKTWARTERCTRCGRAWLGRHAYCDRCREKYRGYMAKYRKGKVTPTLGGCSCCGFDRVPLSDLRVPGLELCYNCDHRFRGGAACDWHGG